MDTPYTPIDCGIYDHLELHAMRGTRLQVEYHAADGSPHRLENVRLVTIRQEAGEELAVFRGTEGHETEVRLDRLRLDRLTSR